MNERMERLRRKAGNQLLKEWFEVNKIQPQHHQLLTEIFIEAARLVQMTPPLSRTAERNQSSARLDRFRNRTKWKDRGPERRRENPLHFIEQVYPDRRDVGLCQADIHELDEPLYNRLQHFKQANPVPNDFDLPQQFKVTRRAAKVIGLERTAVNTALKIAAALQRQAR